MSNPQDPFSLHNVATADGYTAAATLADCPLSVRIQLQVFNAAVVYQLQLPDNSWAPENFLAPYVGSFNRVCTGIRFRSAVAGTPAQLSVELIPESELSGAADSGGSPGLTLDSAGRVGPIDTVLTTGDFFYSSTGTDRTLAIAVTAGRLLNAVADPTLEGLWNLWGIQFGGTSKSSFAMPDIPGRVIVTVGSHADVSALGKNDGVSIANRTPNHATTPGTFAIDDHVHGPGTLDGQIDDPGIKQGANVTGPDAAGSADNQTRNVTISGNTGNPTTHPLITGKGGPAGARPSDVVPFFALYLMVVK